MAVTWSVNLYTLLQKALLDFSCQDSSPVGGGNAHLSWFTALQ